MPRFEVRPTSVDAMRVPFHARDDDEWERLFAWLERSRQWSVEPRGIEISTAWGVRVAYPGDWIARDDDGALSVYTAAEFAATFAPAPIDPAMQACDDQYAYCRLSVNDWCPLHGHAKMAHA